ncbi:MAG: ADP compounds hydrolase NudE [Coxiella sp. (in: Bacteria)]|nr:MAG: ADP compounds hydrolase NudE [Coxiella sp. (in: g-proteobacteria)]
MEKKQPEILGIKEIARSRIFKIEEVHLRYSNGEERHYERVEGRSKRSVLVVPVLDDNTILLIREYGTGIDAYTIGFPKGAVDEGEEILDAANRELMEEVGYSANTLQHAKEVSTSPSYKTNKMQIVVARGLTPATAEGDEPEILDVVPWKLDNIDALLANPEFNEARSIAALFLLLREK